MKELKNKKFSLLKVNRFKGSEGKLEIKAKQRKLEDYFERIITVEEEEKELLLKKKN